MYIALFSHFIPCGVHEAVYIRDGLILNGADVKPDTIHGDTQAQSGPMFGLSYLTGINLMPRMRNIKDLVLYKADRRRKYKHIDSLCRKAINWKLIERHYPDMMRVAVSIKAGKMTPSTILRRLGSESTKNRLYFALRELGRVIRTLFLLKYLNDPELRRTIHAATNKSEQFNDLAQWLMFGGEGVSVENVRHEQRKVIKYDHLIANMVILYNVQWMSRKLKELQQKGHPVDAEVLKVLHRTGGSISTGSGTICWICNAPFHHSIRPSISHSNQQLRPRCGGFLANPGRTSKWSPIVCGRPPLGALNKQPSAKNTGPLHDRMST